MKKVIVIMFVALLVAGFASLVFPQVPAGETGKQSSGPAGETKKDGAASSGETKKEEAAKVTPGLYNCELTDINFSEFPDKPGATGSLKLQLDLKADGTFLLEGYLTLEELEFEGDLFLRLRGNWKQDGETIALSDLLEQHYIVDTETLSPWGPPQGGQTTETSKIRNVTKDTFQQYDEKTKRWWTWNKL